VSAPGIQTQFNQNVLPIADTVNVDIGTAPTLAPDALENVASENAFWISRWTSAQWNIVKEGLPWDEWPQGLLRVQQEADGVWEILNEEDLAQLGL
jgi:hypothetical protein